MRTSDKKASKQSTRKHQTLKTPAKTKTRTKTKAKTSAQAAAGNKKDRSGEIAKRVARDKKIREFLINMAGEMPGDLRPRKRGRPKKSELLVSSSMGPGVAPLPAVSVANAGPGDSGPLQSSAPQTPHRRDPRSGLVVVSTPLGKAAAAARQSPPRQYDDGDPWLTIQKLRNELQLLT